MEYNNSRGGSETVEHNRQNQSTAELRIKTTNRKTNQSSSKSSSKSSKSFLILKFQQIRNSAAMGARRKYLQAHHPRSLSPKKLHKPRPFP